MVQYVRSPRVSKKMGWQLSSASFNPLSTWSSPSGKSFFDLSHNL